MAHPRLRVFCGSQEHNKDTASRTVADQRQEAIAVPLGEVFPALVEALQSGLTWPQDFKDDEIIIPMDLYEVILAFEHHRRESA